MKLALILLAILLAPLGFVWWQTRWADDPENDDAHDP